MKINKQYNRQESITTRMYFTDFGFRRDYESTTFYGYIKIKLVHKEQFSLIIPDILCIEDKGELRWFQPLAFTANQLFKDKSIVHNFMAIDLSCGNNVHIRFKNTDYIKSYPDGSQLHSCEITGAMDLIQYATGTAYLNDSNDLLIKLYHHTKEEFGKLIEQEQKFKLSAWNIQGTRVNVEKGFLYFTSLDNIRTNGDLEQIAMSGHGKILLVTDGTDISSLPLSRLLKQYKSRVLLLKVYRENSTNRNYRMDFFVPSHIIAPQHLYRHYLQETGAYYEVCKPFIHRVCCSDKDAHIHYDNETIKTPPELHHTNYIVIGDCSLKKGLEAPYNEENTTHIFKIEPSQSLSILDYWFEFSNTDLFSNRNADLERYKDPKH